MSNEAAERLRHFYVFTDGTRAYNPEMVKLLDAALVAERRATVERIRAACAAAGASQMDPLRPFHALTLIAILDAESL